jgi:UDP-N-acetylglucosamine--dolichyl-phosphate N-acetylglucosaminephosphotransferase
MEKYFLFLSPLIAFLITFLVLPFWIKRTKKIGLVWEDMNKAFKEKKIKVSSSGGIIVIMGFVIGIFVYIAIKTFILGGVNGNIINTLALITVVLMFSLIGIVDDLLGWRFGGLSKKVRLILALVASVPLIALNIGVSSMAIPFFGTINLGIIYPLFLVPFAIVGCSTVYNFLAGYNGLEASQGIIVLSALSFVAYRVGEFDLVLVGIVMVSSLFAFYLFNLYPAKVFPGDSMTLSIGALIAGISILGNFEKIAVFIFIPYILEMILKLRGGLKKYSFGKPNKDGTIDLLYDKIYGLEHLSIYILKKIKPNKKVYEKEVVYLINSFQIIVILIGFFLFL